MEGLLAGTIAGCLAIAALVTALAALRAPSRANGEVLRAFKTLENDFSELQDRVNSHLGRISRLRRGILSSAPTEPDGAPKADESPSPAAVNPPAPMTRSRLLAIAKKKGAVTYGEESERIGDASG